MAVEGTKELLKKFEMLSTAGKTKVLRAASRAAGAAVVKEAKARIPVGSESHRTYDGTLVSPGFARRSIRAVTFVDKRSGKVGVRVGVRARAFYAINFVELEKGNSRHRGKPWLKPSFGATEKQQIEAFESRMRKVINKAVKMR
jgi:HK97 gp10 family phage protein